MSSLYCNITYNDRKVVFDELGRKKTLSSGKDDFVDLFGNSIKKIGSDSCPILLLGIGPFPNAWQQLFINQEENRKIFWIESPLFEKQMPEEWHKCIPAHWEKISLKELLELHTFLKLSDCHIYRYLPSYRLFSTFWGMIIGKLQLTYLNYIPPISSSSIILSGTEKELLTYELNIACQQIGFIPLYFPPQGTISQLFQIVKEQQPSLFLSINLQGLDNEGYFFYLLQASKIPVAIWLVDNPWHVLSKLRSPWWKEATLFITDRSFIHELHRHGAQNVYVLPLAAWTKTLLPNSTNTTIHPLKPLVFIGNASFPNKKQFFSGLQLPNLIISKAKLKLNNNNPPHIHWWVKQLAIKQCWPGKKIRLAGLGAEECSLLKRQLWLTIAAEKGLTLFGNPEWKYLLPPKTDVRSPIDYYTTVPHVYKQAKYTLNITSLLLPKGLTQRHFDVWMFDGFLITDATEGLSLFPKELTEFITIQSVKDLHSCIERFEKDTTLRLHLMHAWKKHLIDFHLYSNRLQNILSFLQINI